MRLRFSNWTKAQPSTFDFIFVHNPHDSRPTLEPSIECTWTKRADTRAPLRLIIQLCPRIGAARLALDRHDTLHSRDRSGPSREIFFPAKFAHRANGRLPRPLSTEFARQSQLVPTHCVLLGVSVCVSGWPSLWGGVGADSSNCQANKIIYRHSIGSSMPRRFVKF